MYHKALAAEKPDILVGISLPLRLTNHKISFVIFYYCKVSNSMCYCTCSYGKLFGPLRLFNEIWPDNKFIRMME